MVLNQSQYKNVRKEELIQEFTDISSSFVNDINTKLSSPLECNEFLTKHSYVSFRVAEM